MKVFDHKNRAAIFWLPFALFLIHSVEEIAFGFPEWATAHFGSTTRFYFLQHHIPLFIVAFASSYLAAKQHGSVFWRVLTTVWQIQSAVNGLFHVITTIAFREYSPGAVTGLLLFLPLTYYFVTVVWKERFLTDNQFRISFTAGLIVAMATIASLWIEG